MRRIWLPAVIAAAVLLSLYGDRLRTESGRILSRDGDPAQHLLLGRLMIERGGLLPAEPTCYAAPADKPFVAYEWLSQLLLAAAHAALGLAGPVLLATALAFLTFVLLHRRLRLGGVGPALAMLWTCIVLLQGWHRIMARPHLFSWPLALLFVSGLEAWRRRRLGTRNALLVGVPLLVAWTNLHGGVLLACALLAAYGVGEAVDRWRGLPDASRSDRPRLRTCAAGVGVLLLATLLNPWGPGLHAHLLRFLVDSTAAPLTSEFAPLDLARRQHRFFLVLAAVCVIPLALRGRRVPTAHALLWFGLLGMAIASRRHMMMFLILVPAVAFTRLADDAGSRSRGPVTWLPAACVLALLVAVAAWRSPGVSFHPRLQPVEAVRYVKAHPEACGGRMYNHYGWGGYLAYELYPAQQTFINGLLDHYGRAHAAEYLTVANVDPGWADVLRRHGVAWAIVRAQSEIADTMRADDAWVEGYTDDVAGVFLRRP